MRHIVLPSLSLGTLLTILFVLHFFSGCRFVTDYRADQVIDSLLVEREVFDILCSQQWQQTKTFDSYSFLLKPPKGFFVSPKALILWTFQQDGTYTRYSNDSLTNKESALRGRWKFVPSQRVVVDSLFQPDARYARPIQGKIFYTNASIQSDTVFVSQDLIIVTSSEFLLRAGGIHGPVRTYFEAK
jgi:hypothetical protein